MTSTNEDTSREHDYRMSRLVVEEVEGNKVGTEVFFSRRGISYGRGRIWYVSPKLRVDLLLNIPVKEPSLRERTRRRALGKLSTAEAEASFSEWEAFNDPEFLVRLDVRLKSQFEGKIALPDDAFVARCTMEADTEAFFAKEVERAYSERNLWVLVLSNSYRELGEGNAHPDIERDYG